jgi:glycosyltransferase involved in cell wall biosynthesis
MQATFTFGLFLIVKNAAHEIGRILDLAGGFDQVVVVDTGSTDGTVELIQKKYPFVQLDHFVWIHDFAAARNFALSHIKTDVWMWLDADDTFTQERFNEWKKLAAQLWQNRKTECAYVLPYHYAVNKDDQPVVLEYRERIFLNEPGRFQWREPIHEVCAQLPTAHPQKAIVPKAEAAVVHRPTVEMRDPDRNWKILNAHLLKGNFDVRTLYYVQLEALAHNQPEYSLLVGRLLVGKNPEPFIFFESMKRAGDAYAVLYKAEGVAEYGQMAEGAYREACRLMPERNEARDALIDFLVSQHRYDEALTECDKLNEAVPRTATMVRSDRYGGYKNVLKERIRGLMASG